MSDIQAVVIAKFIDMSTTQQIPLGPHAEVVHPQKLYRESATFDFNIDSSRP